jgi:hypothetical protein
MEKCSNSKNDSRFKVPTSGGFGGRSPLHFTTNLGLLYQPYTVPLVSSGNYHFTDARKECPKKDRIERFEEFRKKGRQLIEQAQQATDHEEAKQKYQKAAAAFGNALRECSNSPDTSISKGEITHVDIKNIDDGGNIVAPQTINTSASETRIYFNNALIGSQVGNGQTYTIAVAAPIGNGRGFSIIGGVAQRQAEINNEQVKLQFPIKILLVDDSDQEYNARKSVSELVKKNVLGVIGNQTSTVTFAVKPDYEKEHLPAVSPSATTLSLETSSSVNDRYVFRTTPSIRIIAKKIHEHVTNNKTIPRDAVAILFNSNSNNNNNEYSKSFKDELADAENFGSAVTSYDLAQKSADDISRDLISNTRIKRLIIALSAEVLNPAIKLHTSRDKGGRQEVEAPVDDGTASTQFQLHIAKLIQ